MFSSASTYDTMDLLEDLNICREVVAELYSSNGWNLSLAGGMDLQWASA